MKSFLQKVRLAKTFFPLADKKTAVRQAIKWAKSVDALGDRWILSQPSKRLEHERPV